MPRVSNLVILKRVSRRGFRKSAGRGTDSLNDRREAEAGRRGAPKARDAPYGGQDRGRGEEGGVIDAWKGRKEVKDVDLQAFDPACERLVRRLWLLYGRNEYLICAFWHWLLGRFRRCGGGIWRIVGRCECI